MGQERMLNDKGRKIVKERNKILNEESAHNYFYNIDESTIFLLEYNLTTQNRSER